MVWGYGLYSLGELLVSGLGLAMIARYVPARMGGFMMGAYYVASGISQYLGSVVANFASIPQRHHRSAGLAADLHQAVQQARLCRRRSAPLIALAMLPLMNKLSASHSDAATNHNPLPAGRAARKFDNPA